MPVYSGNEFTLKDALETMFKEFGLEEKLREVHINNEWEKLMGRTIYIRTKEVKLKKRKLYIRVDSSALKEELIYARSKVLELVNKEFKEPVADEVVIL
jgi:hypothetical protein